MYSATVVKNIPNNDEYYLNYFLNKEELNYYRKTIENQWFYRLQILDPKIASFIYKNNITITNYHLISNRINHSIAWNKSSRILPPSFVDWFLNTEFAKTLENKFGNYTISDEDDMGFPNIYWRLVRPNEPSDIGPLHRDSWFWILNTNFPKPNYKFHRLKVWISIFVEPNLNGLKVEPKSQLRDDIEWKGEERHGINKPVLLTTNDNINPILLNTKAGQAVIFNDELIHGGSLNNGNHCRVSTEFTLLIKE